MFIQKLLNASLLAAGGDGGGDKRVSYVFLHAFHEFILVPTYTWKATEANTTLNIKFCLSFCCQLKEKRWVSSDCCSSSWWLIPCLFLPFRFHDRCREGYQGIRCDQFLPKTDSILSDPSEFSNSRHKSSVTCSVQKQTGVKWRGSPFWDSPDDIWFGNIHFYCCWATLMKDWENLTFLLVTALLCQKYNFMK